MYTMQSDRLLSELQRQEKYLAKLPKDFTFPLFNARQALESQRRSGYRDTASASREIVDNSIEAGADRVHIIFDSGRNDAGRRQVNAIAFIDNGSGMLPQMARFALTWGGGTHFDEPSFIGKFGFGLPNASINQTRRVEVYTRTNGRESFTKAVLDINQINAFGLQTIPEPEEADLPQFVRRYVDRERLDLDHGTVVVWMNPDRLTYRQPGPLKDHLVDDFGVVYRYLLADPDRPLELVVEGTRVEPVDPLFLMPGARLYLPPDQGGAILSAERFLSVKYYLDPTYGEHHLKWITDPSELNADDPNLLAAGVIQIRIARFPIGFVQEKRRGHRKEGATDAEKRFEIRKTRRGISFVRSGREIQTLDAFPRTARDEANGLGHWPLLQGYAYHWGVEIKFGPELDEVFGITNDKQGVRPIEDFWKILAQAEIDALLRAENKWQTEQRERKVRDLAIRPDGPTAAELAAQDADVAEGKKLRIPPRALPNVQKELEEAAKQRAEVLGRSMDEMRDAILKEAQRRPYHVDFYDSEDGPFYKPAWGLGGQVQVLVNRRHPFYEVLYSSLLTLPGGVRAKEAVDVLLITLAKAELLVEDEQLGDWYVTQRKQRWSPFLETALRSLRQRLETMGQVVVEEEESDGIA